MKGLACIAFMITGFLFPNFLKAQEPLRAAVYYKTSSVTGDQNDFQSACHMMDVAGLPYDVISSSEDISDYRLVLVAVRPDVTNTTDQDIQRFEAYILKGGSLIFPLIRDIRLYPVAGVTEMVQNANSPVLDWQKSDGYDELIYFDDPFEIQTSIGKSVEQTIPAGYYVISEADALARYSDGEPGVVRNTYGTGYCYSFGFRWRDVILRSQLGYDYSANRSFSNGFEPSADVFPLFLRAVWIKVCSTAVWKHTSPDASLSSLMITHDVDSRTGMDTMQYFSTYEKESGLRTHYFITTRYFKDDLMSNFYNPTAINQLKAVMADGHTIGSHSVGHFPDMKDTVIFPAGKPGVNPNAYQPRYFEQNGFTTGGTLWGEAQVSKTLLENDLNISIRSWRPGHLLTPKYMFQILDSAGYAYSSTFSANDILCNFPFINKGKLSFYGSNTNLLEIPMTLSDVYSDNPISPTNYPQLVEIWKDVVLKNMNNEAPTVLLIHPNRRYKVNAQAMLVNSLPPKVGLVNFEDYADFWMHRLTTDYALEAKGDSVMIIKMKQSDIMKHPPVSFAMRNKAGNPIIRIVNEFGVEQPVYYTTYTNLVLVHTQSMTGIDYRERTDDFRLTISPNPSRSAAFANFTSTLSAVAVLSVYDLHARRISSENVKLNPGVNNFKIRIRDWQPGVYMVHLHFPGGLRTAKLIVY